MTFPFLVKWLTGLWRHDTPTPPVAENQDTLERGKFMTSAKVDRYRRLRRGLGGIFACALAWVSLPTLVQAQDASKINAGDTAWVLM